MKIKKFHFVRPEIEVESARPIIGRLYLALIYPSLIKVKAATISHAINHYYPGTQYITGGTVRKERFYVVAIPKVHWIDKRD